MFDLMEENKQMRAELEGFRSSSFDLRAAEVAQDNTRLRKRNGEL